MDGNKHITQVNAQPSPVNANFNVSADLTDGSRLLCEETASWSKGARGLVRDLIGGKWWARRKADVARIEANSKKEISEILAQPNTAPITEVGNQFYEAVEHIDANKPIEISEEVCDYVSYENRVADGKRLIETVAIAVAELKDLPDEELAEEGPDKDFLNKWRREAEIIDDEEIRKLWAKILVEEVKKPKSISKRTLDTLKDISKDEARLFEKLLVDIWNGRVFIANAEIANPETSITPNSNLTFKDFLMLTNANLMLPSNAIANIKSRPRESNCKVDGQDWFALDIAPNLLVASNNPIGIKGRSLTTAGSELADLFRLPLETQQAINIAKVIARRKNTNQVFRLYSGIIDKETKEFAFQNVLWEEK